MGMKIKGHVKAINGIGRVIDTLPDETSKGIEKSTRKLYTDSQVQVPKKTTALANSAHYVEHSTTGAKRSRGVRYGEPGEGEGVIDYAAAVHEILKAHHAPPTKAKYVEDPLVQGIPEYRRYLGESSQRAVRRAFR